MAPLVLPVLPEPGLVFLRQLVRRGRSVLAGRELAQQARLELLGPRVLLHLREPTQAPGHSAQAGSGWLQKILALPGRLAAARSGHWRLEFVGLVEA